MSRRRRGIGETKLKILAIIHQNGGCHGYGIWRILREKFYTYLDDKSRRNVYHHLLDLKRLGLVERSPSQMNHNAPENHPYKLTSRGKMLKYKFKGYLDIL